MGFNFKAKKEPKKPARSKSEAPDEKSEEYRERAKAERERFELATQGDIWICVCFKDCEDMGAFDAITGSCEKIAPGSVFESMLESRLEKSSKRLGRVRSIPASPARDNPYSRVEYTGSLEHDCIAEAMAIFDAFDAYQPKSSYSNVFESSYWRCFAFKSSDECRRVIATYQLARFGDKYMDGSALLKRLNR